MKTQELELITSLSSIHGILRPDYQFLMEIAWSPRYQNLMKQLAIYGLSKEYPLEIFK